MCVGIRKISAFVELSYLFIFYVSAKNQRKINNKYYTRLRSVQYWYKRTQYLSIYYIIVFTDSNIIIYKYAKMKFTISEYDAVRVNDFSYYYHRFVVCRISIYIICNSGFTLCNVIIIIIDMRSRFAQSYC